MNRILAIVLGVAVAFTAYADGFPSRPRFQAVGVGSNAPTMTGTMRVGNSTFQEASGAAGTMSIAGTVQASLYLFEGDAAANEKTWRWVASGGDLYLSAVDDAQAAPSYPLTVSRTGTTVDTIALAATSVTVNGSAVLTAATGVASSSGTFTAVLTGMSANPNLTLSSWAKTGNIGCVQILNGVEATSNATTMTITGLPAAIAPVVSGAAVSGTVVVTDNGTAKIGSWSIANGATTISFSNGPATVGVGTVAFTNSGTKGIPQGLSACWRV